MDKYTQRNSDGSVDLTASAEAYTEALSAWISQNEIPADRISSAVNTVLGRATGCVVSSTLTSLVATQLGASADTHKAVSARVAEFVKAQVSAGKLFSYRGAGGGISAVARPVKSA